jgi:hypothetical protein
LVKAHTKAVINRDSQRRRGGDTDDDDDDDDDDGDDDDDNNGANENNDNNDKKCRGIGIEIVFPRQVAKSTSSTSLSISSSTSSSTSSLAQYEVDLFDCQSAHANVAARLTMMLHSLPDVCFR